MAVVDVPVSDDQFDKNPESILTYFDDNTGEVEGYLDCSMGRPVPMKEDLNEGMYTLVMVVN